MDDEERVKREGKRSEKEGSERCGNGNERNVRMNVRIGGELYREREERRANEVRKEVGTISLLLSP